MKNLIYSFFITLLILILKVEFNWYVLIILICIWLFTISKHLKYQLVLGILIGLALNPIVRAKNKTNILKGTIENVREKYFIVDTKTDKVVVWSNAQPKKGSKIRFTGKSQYLENTSSFKEKKFWNAKGVSYKVLNPKFIKIVKQESRDDYVYSWFKLIFKNQKDEKTQKIYKVFQELGLAHIIVISSFHLSMLFYLLIWFKKSIRLIFLILFCWYIGFPPAAQKALLFISIITFNNKIDKIQALALSGYIMLIYQPFIAYNDSFILTMLFSTIILLFSVNTNKWQKITVLRLIGMYITWLWTSSIYLLNFITIFLSPIIFVIYFAIFLRIKWLLKLIEAFLFTINKINFPIVIGQNLFMKITLLLIIIILIRNISLFHKNSKQSWVALISIVAGFKMYFRYLSFVVFLNVGQGDAAIVKLKNQTYLIDVGKKGQFKKVIKPYLLKSGISKIDNIYISHNHFDHAGGLQDDFKWIKILNNPNPKIINLNTKKWGTENDNSQVLYFSYKNKSFLFTGDISKKVENYICHKIDRKVDVLKVAHHGSNTSTSRNLIATAMPKTAIISYGKNNYGHPHKEVLNILNEYNVYIHETNKSGHLKIML